MRSPGSVTGCTIGDSTCTKWMKPALSDSFNAIQALSIGGEAAPLRRLLAILRKIEVTRAKPPEPRNDQQRFIDEYRRYLLRERGLAETSLLNYVPFAEQFLSGRFGQAEIKLPELTAADVTKFMRDRVHQLSSGRAKLLVTALRSFLRYLRHQGKISVDLAGCVPPVAVWSLSAVPKFLPAGTVQRILDHCARDTRDGKRNYAVLLLLARLGLRACEIVALSLDDIDWDNGRITIRCKGGRWAQLPQPTLVKLSQSTCALAVRAVSAVMCFSDIELLFAVSGIPSQSPQSSGGR